MSASRVTASIATIPSRLHTLEKTVASLLPQVDQLNVYLNGFDGIPDCVRHPNVSTATSQGYGDRGDAGKFFWTGRTRGYYFACDDDLVYPPDYVSYLKQRIDDYGKRVIVSLHGALLKEPIESYYRDRESFSCLTPLPEDRFVHVVGTGVCAFHTAHVPIHPDVFSLPNMADIWLALFARANDIPLVVLQHPHSYVRYQIVPDTIYDRAMRDGDQLQTEIINRGAPWGLPLAATATTSFAPRA